MTRKSLKQKLISIRNGALITPLLEEIFNEMTKRGYKTHCDKTNKLHYLKPIK